MPCVLLLQDEFSVKLKGNNVLMKILRRHEEQKHSAKSRDE